MYNNGGGHKFSEFACLFSSLYIPCCSSVFLLLSSLFSLLLLCLLIPLFIFLAAALSFFLSFLYSLLLLCSLVLPFLAHLSRRLRGELLVYQWLRCPSSFRRPSVNIFKHLLLWNHWGNWTQISYGDSLGWGNQRLFKCSWSHDQDGHHAHIW